MPTSSGIEAGRAYLRLLIDSASADQDLNRFEGDLKRRLAALSTVGAGLSAVGGAITAPLAASVRLASNAQEIFSRFQQVFRDQSRAAQDFAATYSGALTQTQFATQDTLSSFFAQFSGLGAEASQAREVSQELTAAVADFESFNNLQAGDSLRRFLSAIAGEIEPLRRFGIDVSDLRVNRELLEQGFVGGTRGVDFLTKALTRAKIILETVNSLGISGDVERTYSQFTNQVRGISRAVQNAAGSVGATLLPVLETLTPLIISSAEFVGDLADSFPELTLVAAGTGAALLGVGVPIFALATAVSLNLPLLRALRSLLVGTTAASGAQASATTAAATATNANAAAAATASTSTAAMNVNLAGAAAGFAAEAATATIATAALAAYSRQKLLAGASGLIPGPTLGTPRLPGPAQLRLPGPAATGGAAAAASGFRVLSVTTNDLTQRTSLLSRVWQGFTGALRSGFLTFIALGGSFRRIIASALRLPGLLLAGGRAAVGFIGSLGPGGAAIGATATALAIMGNELLKWRIAAKASEDSNERLADSLERYGDRVREFSQFDPSEAYQKASEAAREYADSLDRLRSAREELAALEEAGQGESPEAGNIRRRIPKLEEETREASGRANAALNAADPEVISETFRGRATQLRQEIRKIEAEIESTRFQDVRDRLEQELRGKQEALQATDQGSDPAIGVILSALQSEVIGGTAADPEQRQNELRQAAERLEALYRRRGNDQQANRFAQLVETIERAEASAIGGREAPVIAGVEDGDKTLEAEARRRADAEAQSDRELSEARIALIEDELQRELAAIEQKRQADLAAATERGQTNRTLNNINAIAQAKTERANLDAQERRRKEEERIAETTQGLRFQARNAELNASGLGDNERRLRQIELRREEALADPGLSDEQRGLINRRFDADRDLAVADAADRELRELRRRRQQRLSLDVSELVTQNPAAALAIGPPGNIAERQLQLAERQRRLLRDIRDGINRGTGIPGR